jgi:hypothetical protein
MRQPLVGFFLRVFFMMFVPVPEMLRNTVDEVKSAANNKEDRAQGDDEPVFVGSMAGLGKGISAGYHRQDQYHDEFWTFHTK